MIMLDRNDEKIQYCEKNNGLAHVQLLVFNAACGVLLVEHSFWTIREGPVLSPVCPSHVSADIRDKNY